MKLDKHDSLIIRVCKANLSKEETVRRLIRIWRYRCMLPKDNSKKELHVYVASRMWEIIEDLELTTLSKVIYKLYDPFDNNRYTLPVDDKLKFILGEAYMILKLSESSKLNGFITPAWFRNGGYKVADKRKKKLTKNKK